MEKLAYNVDEAAEMLSLSRRTIYELMRRGDLGSVKVGKRRLVRKTDLDLYLMSLGSA